MWLFLISYSLSVAFSARLCRDVVLDLYPTVMASPLPYVTGLTLAGIGVWRIR
jgi:hypothetical protein